MNKIKEAFSKGILKKIGDIFHFVLKTILYAVFVFLLFLGFAMLTYVYGIIKNAKSGVYEAPLYSAYIIVSPSMKPTINVEDAIIVQRKAASKLKVKDIITFNAQDSSASGITITHRIVAIVKDKNGKLLFRTKGDNNNVEDSALVKPENIVGKVLLRIPLIGYIQYFIANSYGWLILIVMPCLIIVIYDIVRAFEKIEKSAVNKIKNKDRS
jgi:signal peptidase